MRHTGRVARGLGYAYVHTRLKPRPFGVRVEIYRKVLQVTVDRNDVVTNVEFTTDGEK